MKSVIICALICFTAVAANTFIPQPIVPRKDLKESGSRIIGGELAKPGQFPYQVANNFISSGYYLFCGAALICDRWVLTAAHCAEGAELFILHLGSVNDSQIVGTDRVEVITQTAIIHQNYSAYTLNNDIALLKLDEPIEFTDKIQPIPLGKSRVGEGVPLTVSGWGRTTNDGSLSTVLNYVNLTTISNSECERIYGSSTVKNSTLCCRGSLQHNTCSGDSGGPLVSKNAQGKFEHVGIVSFVHIAGCDSGYPSGYMRTESMLSWILETIDGTCTLP